MVKPDEAKLDVAISFLAKDETLARELNARLDGALNVFFFPRNQETLAGTDGLETMREPFLSSRVAVVIFNSEWGATPWTRVEETAIKERCLEAGWDGLMFVQVDKSTALPKWLPSTHVRFSLEDYGIDQLAGAIKSQVQRLGGKIQKPDALSRGRQVKAEQDFLRDRDAMMRDTSWITGAVHPAIRQTMQDVAGLIAQLNSESQFAIEVGVFDRQGTMRSNNVSLGMGWKQPIANLLADYDGNECYLRVAEFHGNLALPGERVWWVEQPRKLKEHKFKVDVSAARGLVWKEVGKNEVIEPDKLADRLVHIFLNLLSRANSGKF